jgi:hypothetical protein
MPAPHPSLRMLAFALLACATSSAIAEKPQWTSIAELLVGGIGEADPVRMSNVMTRCTALNMIMAGLAADSAPDVSQHYQQEAHRLIENAVLIDSRLEQEATGADANVAAVSNAAIEEVKGLVDGYNQWLDDNLVTGASIFSGELTLEIDTCRLAGRLVAQRTSE